MSEWCERCGRKIAGRAYGGGTGPEPGTTCSKKGSTNCVTAAIARREGLRSGVAIAKLFARPEKGVDSVGRWFAYTNWSDVDAELARRCGDG